MAALPPPDREAATHIRDENAYQGIGSQVVRDAAVASVVRGEHNLVPEEPQEAGRSHVAAAVKEEGEEGEEQGIAQHLLAVLGVMAGVEAFIADSLVQCLELKGDVALGCGVERRVLGEIDGDVMLDLARRVALW